MESACVFKVGLFSLISSILQIRNSSFPLHLFTLFSTILLQLKLMSNAKWKINLLWYWNRSNWLRAVTSLVYYHIYLPPTLHTKSIIAWQHVIVEGSTRHYLELAMINLHWTRNKVLLHESTRTTSTHTLKPISFQDPSPLFSLELHVHVHFARIVQFLGTRLTWNVMTSTCP